MRPFFFFFFPVFVNDVWTRNRQTATFDGIGLFNCEGSLDNKQMFVASFSLWLGSAKKLFRISPRPASGLTQDLVLYNCHTWDLAEMFTSLVQLIFNNTIWYLVTWDVCSVLNKYLDQRMSKKQFCKICIVKTYENKMSIKKSFLFHDENNGQEYK